METNKKLSRQEMNKILGGVTGAGCYASAACSDSSIVSCGCSGAGTCKNDFQEVTCECENEAKKNSRCTNPD